MPHQPGDDGNEDLKKIISFGVADGIFSGGLALWIVIKIIEFFFS